MNTDQLRATTEGYLSDTFLAWRHNDEGGFYEYICSNCWCFWSWDHNRDLASALANVGIEVPND
jgi:hypothetical protein